MDILEPKSYQGFDAEGNCVAAATAEDANQIVNPAEVQAAIEGVNAAAEEGANNIASALNQVEPEADDAVIVQGTKMTGVIEETITAVKSIPGSVLSSISSLYDEAVKIHNQYQQQANENAYNAVQSAPNVETVH